MWPREQPTAHIKINGKRPEHSVGHSVIKKYLKIQLSISPAKIDCISIFPVRFSHFNFMLRLFYAPQKKKERNIYSLLRLIEIYAASPKKAQR